MSDLATKGFCASTMTFYAVTYAEIRLVAKAHGYSLALHGSLQKDLDVIAVPWVENPSDEETLVKAICEAAGGMVLIDRPVADKPHGRRAWTIHLGGCSGTVSPTERATYIDLSVMPTKGAA
jgi:hypothetical protein